MLRGRPATLTRLLTPAPMLATQAGARAAAPSAMSSVRTVRPRPLGVDERIPVYWAGRDAAPEVRAVDGGSLYRYLVAGTPKTGQKRQRGDKYHAPREVRAAVFGASFVVVVVVGIRHHRAGQCSGRAGPRGAARRGASPEACCLLRVSRLAAR